MNCVYRQCSALELWWGSSIHIHICIILWLYVISRTLPLSRSTALTVCSNRNHHSCNRIEKKKDFTLLKVQMFKCWLEKLTYDMAATKTKQHQKKPKWIRSGSTNYSDIFLVARHSLYTYFVFHRKSFKHFAFLWYWWNWVTYTIHTVLYKNLHITKNSFLFYYFDILIWFFVAILLFSFFFFVIIASIAKFTLFTVKCTYWASRNDVDC